MAKIPTKPGFWTYRDINDGSIIEAGPMTHAEYVNRNDKKHGGKTVEKYKIDGFFIPLNEFESYWLTVEEFNKHFQPLELEERLEEKPLIRNEEVQSYIDNKTGVIVAAEHMRAFKYKALGLEFFSVGDVDYDGYAVYFNDRVEWHIKHNFETQYTKYDSERFCKHCVNKEDGEMLVAEPINSTIFNRLYDTNLKSNIDGWCLYFSDDRIEWVGSLKFESTYMLVEDKSYTDFNAQMWCYKSLSDDKLICAKQMTSNEFNTVLVTQSQFVEDEAFGYCLFFEDGHREFVEDIVFEREFKPLCDAKELTIAKSHVYTRENFVQQFCTEKSQIEQSSIQFYCTKPETNIFKIVRALQMSAVEFNKMYDTNYLPGNLGYCVYFDGPDELFVKDTTFENVFHLIQGVTEIEPSQRLTKDGLALFLNEIVEQQKREEKDRKICYLDFSEALVRLNAGAKIVRGSLESSHFLSLIQQNVETDGAQVRYSNLFLFDRVTMKITAYDITNEDVFAQDWLVLK